MNLIGIRGLNARQLKMAATMCMATDHVATAFMPADTGLYLAMRLIGRISFPVFCLLIAEGDRHTKSRMRYIGRLLLFAVISELAYDLVFSGGVNLKDQNIFFTLLIGELVLGAFALIKEKGNLPKAPEALLMIGVGLAGCVAAEFTDASYGGAGVLLIIMFSLLWNNESRMERTAAMAATCMVMALFWSRTPVQLMAVLVIALLLPLYNGERGEQKHRIGYYAFYPLHLLAIGLAELFM